MKTYTTVLASALLATSALAESDKTISFAGKIADFSFQKGDLVQNITLSLDETSKCDLKYKTLPWSVDCALGLSLDASGVLNTDDLTFRASVGGMVSSEDVGESSTQQTMTFYYSATTPEFSFGSAWQSLGVPSIPAKSFPTNGTALEIRLPENKLNEGICVSDVKEHLVDAGITNSGVINAAEVIEATSKLAGNDVCAFVHGLTIDEQQMGASVQFIIQIDLLNEKKVDFDMWGASGGLSITESTFVTTRKAVFGMERPYSQTLNVGKEIYRLIQKALKEEETATGRRMLADDLSYVDAEGNFQMGAYNQDNDTTGASTASVSMFVSFLVAFCAVMNFM